MKPSNQKNVIARVERKTDFGVFVSYPGSRRNALVHKSQLSGNRDSLRVARLNQLKVGDEIIVDIIDDKNPDKISASERSYWEDITMTQLPVNEPMTGKVIGVEDYGLFVQLDKWQIAGLVHVSRMQGNNQQVRDAALQNAK